MKKAAVAAILILTVVACKAIDPPPVPQVPFPFDPNLATGKVIGSVTVPVGTGVTREFGVWLPRDAQITRSCSIGVITDGRRWVDQAGEKWALYTVTYTPSTVGVHYMNFKADAGPLSDTRTFLINATAAPNQPVIYLPLAMRDPNYDYTSAKTDPIEHQKAVKHTQRFWHLQGIPTSEWIYSVRF